MDHILNAKYNRTDTQFRNTEKTFTNDLSALEPK